ncbi:hypothetical protein CABS01_16326 [Colletotrichum abscissum]|uniref:Uncharacterized protein n=1 Tax=Colletotrichum abscissum TaxID=1671311 RepID=A0A9Q0B8I1_9PEZI|nr:uncharacterized protein CABS01_16326 [Colletotrichum abscissum]KAI3557464.1 hypothetical protein CABS02_02123 [Colletotrichum abscissum]KAK1471681.1 hypothetical protein CABS01_16326 [Colletotrichum abscissum]
MSFLDILPAEILLHIQRLLPVESQAILPLLNHKIRNKVGHRPMTLDKEAQHRLLQLLECDGVYAKPLFVACKDCGTFHSPSSSVPPKPGHHCDVVESHSSNPRPCAVPRVSLPEDHLYIGAKMWSNFLPWKLRFNMVAGLLRSQRLRPSGSVAKTLPVSKEFYRIPNFWIQRRTECRIINGSLYLKTRDIVQLQRGTRHTKPRGKFLGKDDRFWYLSGCCPHNHRTWTAGDLKEVLNTGSCHDVSLGSTTNTTEQGSIWEYGQKPPRDVAENNGKIFSCERCWMDYSFEFWTNLPSKARMVILTSWRNLGKGTTDNDPRWRSHLQRSWGRPTRSRLCPRPAKGVYEAYEKS